MGKKYIIEIPEDKIEDFVGSTHFLMPYMMAGHIGHHDTGLPIEPYTEPDLEQIRKEGYRQGYDTGYGTKVNEFYEQGLFDAWETARKIVTMPDRDFINSDILDLDPGESIFTKYTATEAIEKLKAYEQEQEEINVGDEVATDAGNRASVLYENPDGTQVFVFKSDGTAAWWTKNALHRTGRNFPEIASVLEKMRGGQ